MTERKRTTWPGDPENEIEIRRKKEKQEQEEAKKRAEAGVQTSALPPSRKTKE